MDESAERQFRSLKMGSNFLKLRTMAGDDMDVRVNYWNRPVDGEGVTL